MDEQGETPGRAGLRPTLRHMMILILWSAILSALVRTLFNWGILEHGIDFNCILIPILAGFFPLPMLAILIRLLDVKGPVREWYRACCMAVTSVVGGILYLAQDAVCFELTGHKTLMFPISPLLGAFFLFVGSFQFWTVWPQKCMVCGRRAVIPVSLRIRRGSKIRINNGNAGWCAICGEHYQRKGTGPWRHMPPAVK